MGNFGFFLIMRNGGFLASTVGSRFKASGLGFQGPGV